MFLVISAFRAPCRAKAAIAAATFYKNTIILGVKN